MTTQEFTKLLVNHSDVEVWGPRFNESGADNFYIEQTTPIGVVDISDHYPEYIGIVIDTPEGLQVWMAEMHICRSARGRVLLLEDSVSDNYLRRDIVSWGQILADNVPGLKKRVLDL